MKKLKLQVQITVDGFVAGPNGELDWMSTGWDNEIMKYVNDLTDSIDTILMGRKMTDGFVSYWSSVVKDTSNPEYSFARKMVDTPKVVFTKTLDKSSWENTRLAKGNIIEEVESLKKQNGKDLIVYGGASFVSSLVKNNLIDEYNLVVNPAVIGKGLTIFNSIEQTRHLKLADSKHFSSGEVLLKYVPER